MLSASQALNLLSIFVPKKYKGLKRCKKKKPEGTVTSGGLKWLMASVWIPYLAVACGANKTRPKWRTQTMWTTVSTYQKTK